MSDLPKQELLIKLLALTASDSEGEALSAMRKANSLLATAGWTWERLIRGKITVLADPFNNIVEPTTRPVEERRRATVPPAGAQSVPPRAHAPRPARRPRTSRVTLADLGLDS
jgi:hypothetical protein